MGDRLATIDMDRKLAGILIHPAISPQRTWAENWGAPLFGTGLGLGPHLTQRGLGQGLPPYQVAS